MALKTMGHLYILQGKTLILPYKIAYHAENEETYDEYLEAIDIYTEPRSIIFESNGLTNLPSNIKKFVNVEHLEIRGAYFCHLSVSSIPMSITYLSLAYIRNLSIDFYDRIGELINLRGIEIPEAHLTLLPDWTATRIESIIIHVENYNNYLKIRNMAPNSPELWKLIPSMRINKDECVIMFEPHYDQSYLGVVIVNRDLRNA